MFVLVFLWSEIKSTFIKTQKELGLYQRRRPERTAGKFVFGDRPPLISKFGWPPPYLKVWNCHCISCHLDRTSLVNKRFITWPKREGFRRASGRERQVHLSSSGSQSEHRICLTLPAGRVSHIQLIIHLIISSLSSVRQATC